MEPQRARKYIVTKAKRREYHLNRKRKRNEPMVVKAVRVVRILRGDRNTQYTGDITLPPGKMAATLLGWIFESLPNEPPAAIAEGISISDNESPPAEEEISLLG